jgi:hypothetical protein
LDQNQAQDPDPRGTRTHTRRRAAPPLTRALAVEGRSHIFDVIKVNMFGVRQSRLLVVEHPEAGSNVRGAAPLRARRRAHSARRLAALS